MDEELSKLLEDVVVVSKIILNGEVVSTLTVRSETDLRGALRRSCGNGLYYVSVHSDGDEARLLVKDGSVLACSLRTGGNVSLGDKAFSALSSFLSKGGRATIMRFGESILPEDALRRIRSAAAPITLERPTLPHPSRPAAPEVKEVARKAPASVPGMAVKKVVERAPLPKSPKEELIDRLNRVGAPVKDAAIVEGRDYVIIDLICDEEKEIPPPNNIALAALRCYMDCFKLKSGIRRVRVTVHHRKAYSVNFSFKRGDDLSILKAIGSIPELLWKYELFIDKYKYKVRRGSLEISFVLKRRGIYSTANLNELVKEIYERIRREWRGGLVVKAKIGAWGMEFRYPR